MVPVVDRAAVEAEVARRRAILQASFGRWVLTKLGTSLLAFYAVALVIRVFASRGPLSVATSNAVVFFAVPAFMAVFVTWMAARTLFRREALDVERVAAAIAREVAYLTSDGWPLRTLLAGITLGVVAGVPVAMVLWVIGSPIARSGLVAGVVIFASGMLLWAILMAFIIRFATLHLYRRFLRPAPISAAPDTRG